MAFIVKKKVGAFRVFGFTMVRRFVINGKVKIYERKGYYYQEI